MPQLSVKLDKIIHGQMRQTGGTQPKTGEISGVQQQQRPVEVKVRFSQRMIATNCHERANPSADGTSFIRSNLYPFVPFALRL